MTNQSKSAGSLKYAYILGYFSLFLVSLSAMASYFAYDCIGPLTPMLKEQMGLSSQQIGWLYSIYSIPVILFVVLGGVLADKLGVRKAGVLFTALFTLGTVFTAIPNFWVMLAGRFFFGIGAESFYVVMNKVMAKWFKGKGLALAFGVNLFLCRAGTYAAFFGLPWLAVNLSSLTLALWIVAIICIIGLFAVIIYFFVDRFGEEKGYVSFTEEESEEEFHLKDAFKLPLAFWVISLLCVTYYSAIFPFLAFATDFFTERYGMSTVEAARLAGILILISMFTTWAFGVFVDKVGKRATLMIIGSLAMIPCHISMAYTDFSPWISMIVLGISFSLVPAAMWPALPLMVKEKQLGTAYGVIAMVQNIGLFAFPIAVGAIRDYTHSYNLAMVMFAVLGVLGLIFAIWLKLIETREGGYLDKPEVAA